MKLCICEILVKQKHRQIFHNLPYISVIVGNVPNITVEMQPTEGLTPCITKGDRSRKSKGRRVSILVQKDGKSRYSKQSLGLGNILHKEAVKNNRKSRNSSVGKS